MGRFDDWKAREAAKAAALEARVREVAQRYGCTVTHHGIVWRIRGPGVDLLTTDLRTLRPEDMRPDSAGG